MNTIHILQHAPKEEPGLISEWAAVNNREIRTIHVYRNEELPDPESIPSLILLGGTMNIYQHRDHPWLIPEKQMLARYVETGSSIFGICLGGQLLADVLGAKVTQNPVNEIGWFPVNFTSEARSYFPHLPESLTVLHWHGDTFALPKDSIRLAESEGCAEQGFLWNQRILGLQFHPEASPASIAQPADRPVEEPSKFVQDISVRIAGYHRYSSQVKTVFFALLDTLFSR